MKRDVSFSGEQWLALEKLARLGIYAADVLGPDDPQFVVSEAETQLAYAALELVLEHSKDKILEREQRVLIEPPSFDGIQQAYSEGWTLEFVEALDEYGVLRLEDGPLPDNKHALAYVTGRAACGSAYHQRALDWVEAANAMHSAARAIPPSVKLGRAA